jgi:hypothetical protein
LFFKENFMKRNSDTQGMGKHGHGDGCQTIEEGYDEISEDDNYCVGDGCGVSPSEKLVG